MLLASDISSAEHTSWTYDDVICYVFTSRVVPKAYKAMTKLSPCAVPFK